MDKTQPHPLFKLATELGPLSVFFFGLAILNEVIWRTQSTDFWVNFKVFGVTTLTMIFAIAQMPLTRRYHIAPASLEASEAEAGDVSKG